MFSALRDEVLEVAASHVTAAANSCHSGIHLEKYSERLHLLVDKGLAMGRYSLPGLLRRITVSAMKTC